MILLLQSVTTQFQFDIFRFTKCDKKILLQSATGCYYVVCQVLQIVSGITKFYDYHKVRRNKKARSTLPNLYICTSMQ